MISLFMRFLKSARDKARISSLARELQARKTEGKNE